MESFGVRSVKGIKECSTEEETREEQCAPEREKSREKENKERKKEM